MQPFPHFWKDCNACFEKEITFGSGGGFGFATKELPVEKVGAYNCSLVPSLDEFIRLSTTAFNGVPDNIKTILSA